MKMNSNNGARSLVIGEMPDKKFGIIANDKMFDILSSKIYTDKVTAPVRELATNAYDAHVANNNADKPFQVHIPSETEPFFSIRDYGIGMDGQTIEKLYTTYGFSDKSSSNKFTGCLGLGSKSPFAYTDSFEVHSVKDGIKYVYKCYMESGIPHVMKFDEFSSNEESGVFVKFDVEKKDIYAFRDVIRTVFTYFPVKPDMGADKLAYDDVLYRKNGLIQYSNYKFGVLMGNVFYEGKEFLGELFSEPEMKSIQWMINRGLSIDAKIGDYDIAVSREKLEKKDSNRNKALSVINSYIQKQKNLVKKIIDNSKLSPVEMYQQSETVFADAVKDFEKHFYCAMPAVHETIKEFFDKSLGFNLKKKLVFLYPEKNTKGFGKVSYEKYINLRDCIPHTVDELKSFRVVLDKPICRKNYVAYCIENQCDLIITDDEEVYDGIVLSGVRPLQKKDAESCVLKEKKHTANIKIYRINERRRGYYNWNYLSTSDELFNNLKRLKAKERIFYVPMLHKNVVGLPDTMWEWQYNWFENIRNIFPRLGIVGIQSADEEKIKEDKRFVNFVGIFKRLFRNLDRFKYLDKYLSMPCGLDVAQFLQRVKLDTSLMPVEVKYHYDLIVDSVNTKELKNPTTLEKLYLKMFENKLKKNRYMYDYFARYFPLLDSNIKYDIPEGKIKAMQEYIDFKEEQMKKEKAV